MDDELYLMDSSECFYIETDLAFTKSEPFVSDKVIIVFVEKGTARIAGEEGEYSLDTRHLLVLRPGFSLRLVHAASGFLVSLIGFPSAMLHEHTQRLEPNFFLQLYTRVRWKQADYHRCLTAHFKELFCFAVTETGRYRMDLVQSLVTGFVFGFYEMGGHVRETPYPDSSRSRELFHKFVSLLRKHCNAHHDVQFYADELCISPKYLTQITKRMIAQTPKQIIDQRLLHEAMALLGRNDSSIQEISSRLGFVDQSYFGRFFKRLMKMSPQQYRVRPKA